MADLQSSTSVASSVYDNNCDASSVADLSCTNINSNSTATLDSENSDNNSSFSFKIDDIVGNLADELNGRASVSSSTNVIIKTDLEAFWTDVKAKTIEMVPLSSFYYKTNKDEEVMVFKGEDLVKTITKVMMLRQKDKLFVPEVLRKYEAIDQAKRVALQFYKQNVIKCTKKSERLSTKDRYHFVDEESLEFLDARLEKEAHECCTFNLENWPIVHIKYVGGMSDQKFHSYYLKGITDILHSHRTNEHFTMLYDLSEFTIFPKRQIDAHALWQKNNDPFMKARCHGIACVVTTTLVRGFLNLLLLFFLTFLCFKIKNMKTHDIDFIMLQVPAIHSSFYFVPPFSIHCVF